MNFDDIMGGGLTPKSRMGETLTDIFGVDEDFAKKTTRDLVKLTTSTESTDADIIQSAMAMCETKEELAVIMHLHTKTLISNITDQLEEASELLEDSKDVLESLGEDVLMRYAEGMMHKLIKRMGGSQDDLDLDDE
jgi:bacterioferritin (cytochrome b1)